MSSHWNRVAIETQHYFNRLGVYLDYRQAKIAGALMYYRKPMSAALLHAITEEYSSCEISADFIRRLRAKLAPLPVKVNQLESDGRYYLSGEDKLPDLPPIHIVAKTLLAVLTGSFLIMRGLEVLA